MARRRRRSWIAAAEGSEATRTLLRDERLEAEPHQGGLFCAPSQLRGTPNECVVKIQRCPHARILASCDVAINA